MSTQPNPIQRLRLSRVVLEDLVSTVDRTDSLYSGQRDSCRRPVNRPAVLIQAGPGEPGSRHEVYIRNVSTTGASVLHTAFLRTQADCTLVMVTDQRQPISVDASVARCNHISGQMHDVGLRFVRTLSEDEAIKLCITPEEPMVESDTPEQQLRRTLARCRDLANEVHHLVETGAPPEEVLPLLDELRHLEPVASTAA